MCPFSVFRVRDTGGRRRIVRCHHTRAGASYRLRRVSDMQGVKVGGALSKSGGREPNRLRIMHPAHIPSYVARTRTRTHTHTHTHTCPHARAHALTLTHTRTHAHTHNGTVTAPPAIALRPPDAREAACIAPARKAEWSKSPAPWGRLRRGKPARRHKRCTRICTTRTDVV